MRRKKKVKKEISCLSPTEQARIDDIVNRKLKFLNLLDRQLSKNYKPKPEKKEKKRGWGKHPFICGRNSKDFVERKPELPDLAKLLRSAVPLD